MRRRTSRAARACPTCASSCLSSPISPASCSLACAAAEHSSPSAARHILIPLLQSIKTGASQCSLSALGPRMGNTGTLHHMGCVSKVHGLPTVSAACSACCAFQACTIGLRGYRVQSFRASPCRRPAAPAAPRPRARAPHARPASPPSPGLPTEPAPWRPPPLPSSAPRSPPAPHSF